MKQFERTEMLIGREALKRLRAAHVAVFGLGGVGGYAVEALARVGVGKLSLIDNDIINETNLNRQIIATHKTLGQAKTEAMRQRILEINPCAITVCHNIFYSPEASGQLKLSDYDYIIDAIDSVSGKLELAERANEKNVPLISCMGTGNKLDPTAFEVADIFETSECPLAKVMRHELKKRGIKRLKVVYSREKPQAPHIPEDYDHGAKRQTPASISFVPSVAGLILAGEVIKAIGFAASDVKS